MNEKEIAKKILESANDMTDDVTALKNNIQGLLQKYLKLAKDISGGIPDEKTFLKIVASLLDEAVVFPNTIMEAIDGKVFEFLVKKVDSLILDKFLGPDWFEKLKKSIS